MTDLPSFRRVAGCHDDYRIAKAQLSVPDRHGLSRRRFLQAALAGTAGAVVFDSPWARGLSAMAATPAPADPSQGILVLIQCAGGCDGFSMVVPASDPAYYSARGAMAVPASQVHPIDGGFGLHPALTKLAARYQAGNVACVMGVGYPNPNLSHFDSLAYWWSGQPGLQGVPTSGWVGRWLDGVNDSTGLEAVAIDDVLPLHMIGTKSAATALGTNLSSAFGAVANDSTDTAMFNALASMASAPTGLGQWADMVAGNSARSMQLAGKISPLYSPALPTTSDLATRLVLAARLINAGLGVRVISVDWDGDFDDHSDENRRFQAVMADLDAGIDAFYATLSPTWSKSVTLMTFSEFGRRVQANESGTDHGTASTLLVIGDQVKGGLVGEPPSLTNLDDNGNAIMTTDFRSLYASVLTDWLQADAEPILGGTFPTLPLFAGAPAGGGASGGSGGGTGGGSGSSGGTGSGGGSGGSGTGAGQGVVPMLHGPGYCLVTSTGAVAGFGRGVGRGPASGPPAVAAASTPDGKGAWIACSDGSILTTGDAVSKGDLRRYHLNKPVVGMAPTPSGNGYWLVASDGGIFALGDAAFHGSTGGIRLDQPVVGMAATPTGKGYWLVAADGGIFNYGDATFHGSTGGIRLNQPVVGMAPTPTGKGYWLVAADGGIFSFGDATFRGSTGGIRLNQPVVGMAPTATGKGYLLVARDGGIFAYGDAPFRGGLGGTQTPGGVVAIAA